VCHSFSVSGKFGKTSKMALCDIASDPLCGAIWALQDSKLSAFHPAAVKSDGQKRDANQVSWPLFDPATAIPIIGTVKASPDRIALVLMACIETIMICPKPATTSGKKDTAVVKGETFNCDRFTNLQFGGGWYMGGYVFGSENRLPKLLEPIFTVMPRIMVFITCWCVLLQGK
jgi:hypothetical protein